MTRAHTLCIKTLTADESVICLDASLQVRARDLLERTSKKDQFATGLESNGLSVVNQFEHGTEAIQHGVSLEQLKEQSPRNPGAGSTKILIIQIPDPEQHSA